MNLIVNNVTVLFALSVLSFSRFSGETHAITLSKLIVPEFVQWNKAVTLECLYTLENGERLVRVQWYRDTDEFYRYDLRLNPPQVTYAIEHFNVDKAKSNDSRVALRNVNLMMRGVYKCEVSAKARILASTMRGARMEVIAVPKEGPRIHGMKDVYQIGDAINLTCTSDKSYPPAKLRWFINNEEIRTKCDHETDSHGLVNSRTKLWLTAVPEHFIDGRIEIVCQATMEVNNRTLPVSHNNPVYSPTKSGLQTSTLVLAHGNTIKVVSNVFHSLAPIWLCFLFNGIT